MQPRVKRLLIGLASLLLLVIVRQFIGDVMEAFP